MNAPAISVIVPVYNVESYLERCVRSILSQTFSDFEVILVDDGSTDSCGAMCDAFAVEDNRVRVIHKQNGGLSDARNTGIEAARGTYVEFVDSDDYIEPENLQILLSLIQEHDCDIAAGGIANCYTEKRLDQCAPRPDFVCAKGEAVAALLESTVMTGSSCGKLIKKDALNGHRFPLGKTYEDAFFLPSLLFDCTVAVTTRSLYNYWHRENSITTLPFSEKAMHIIEAYEYTLQFVRDHCPTAIAVAEFKLYWAHFVVLDRMMATKHYRNLPQYKSVVSFLKNNWRAIAKCPYFQRSRRIAALALKVNVELYHLLSWIKQRQDGIHV